MSVSAGSRVIVWDGDEIHENFALDRYNSCAVLNLLCVRLFLSAYVNDGGVVVAKRI